LLTVLKARGIDVPGAARERIMAEKDAGRLERWLEKAVVAASLDQVLDEPG
jgi:post-segregation antitoxin (ccd killing protein)